MGTLQTVLGPIDDGQMGITMSHTHLTLDIRCWYRQLDSPVLRRLQEGKITLQNLGWARHNYLLVKDNLVLDDLDLVAREVQDYRLGGGQTLVVVDLPGIGRDPQAMQKIARGSGLNIVASTGWYMQASHPAEIAGKSIQELAELMIEEITVGIGNTGVKAGNIGELAMSGAAHEPFQPGEEAVLRAAARAQGATGVSLTVHPNHPYDHWDTYIDILEREGADLRKCYMAHLGFYTDIEVAKRLLRRGAGYVSFDNLGAEETFWEVLRGPDDGYTKDRDEVRMVVALLEAGYADRILMSTEMATKLSYKRYGGYGWGYLFETIIPWLRSLGASEADIRQITIENPRRLHSVG